MKILTSKSLLKFCVSNFKKYATQTVLCLICACLISGCAITRYETPDGTKVSYYRLFTTADKMSAQIGDAKVDINKQQINMEALKDAINMWNATR